jgi:RNA polymerase sigma-70 factor (ECF subfamily)
VAREPVDEARFRREQADLDSLFRAHYPEIVRYLTVRLGSREEGSDLACEVFVEAVRSAPGLRWRGRPVLAWLYRVAANMAADRLRQRAREVPVEQVPELGVEEPDSLPDRDALVRALGHLPADQQLAVHLRLVEGRPFTEVGRLMGRSPAACQMLVLRAGRTLRGLLEREGLHAPR